MANRVPKGSFLPFTPGFWLWGRGLLCLLPHMCLLLWALGPFLPLTSPSPWLPAWAWGSLGGWGAVTQGSLLPGSLHPLGHVEDLVLSP